ncbi:hypothetical protein WK91_19970 [Burkholderia cepacia]|nr:hypothetical protein WK91_19970 [Burkholderia cepacia]
MSQCVFASGYVAGDAFESRHGVLDCPGCFGLWSPGEIVQCLVQFSCSGVPALLAQLRLTLTDRSFKDFRTSGLDTVVDKLPANTCGTKKTIHSICVLLAPAFTFCREHFDQVIDLKPFTITDQIPHLPVNIGKLRPIAFVRRPV